LLIFEDNYPITMEQWNNGFLITNYEL